jgi:hypothetical protein
MDSGLSVTRGSRGNRNSEDLSLFSGEFFNRYPFSVPKDKNRGPVQFWDGIFVAVRIDKTTCRIPTAIMRSDPVRARPHDYRPNTPLRFVRLALRELIRENEERSLPQRTVVVRYQFRL